MNTSNNNRYPYTYAADFLRARVTEFDDSLGIAVPAIGRSQASRAIAAVALALDISTEQLVKQIADKAIELGEAT